MNNKLVKDAIFGAIGGAAGTFVLDKVMGFLSGYQSKRDKWLERELIREEPTQALARKAASSVGIDLGKERKQQLGTAVHWGYGIAWGAIYGVLRNRVGVTSKAAGVPFGIGFGLFGEGLLLPTFNLTPPATEFPISSHLVGVAAHCAYAATAEAVCSALEAADHALGSSEMPLQTNPELRKAS